MKVLLTGADGQLGKSISKSQPKSIELINLNKNEFNLLDQEQCRKIIKELKPQWIINCAAYTNVDQAEKKYNLAYKINTLAPQFITQYLNEIQGKLIHISSDYVFDGSNKKPYKPLDQTNPLNNYGITKAEGEKKLLKFDNNIILRTSWLYSSSGHNFMNTMLKLHHSKGIINENLNVVNDQISAPTSTRTLANICWKIIIENPQINESNQIMHWRDSGVASWYDFAMAIGMIAKEKNILEFSANIIPIQTKDYIVPAKRPYYSLLNIEGTEKQFNIVSNHWINELEKTIEELL